MKTYPRFKRLPSINDKSCRYSFNANVAWMPAMTGCVALTARFSLKGPLKTVRHLT
jgi:hypothetical protein